MNKIEAQSASKLVATEIFSLNPSTVVTLFEIDFQDIAFDLGLVSLAKFTAGQELVFRFHNTFIKGSSPIIWRGVEYKAAPIEAEGFETNTQGTLPQPTLRLTVNDKGLPYLTQFKTELAKLGDITGATVTRIRTFAKYLDQANFINSVVPDSFDPNPNVELPRDIFYIERRKSENKYGIEWELSTSFEIEGKKLPGRLVIQNKCNAEYRGVGCLYEYDARRNFAIHGTDSTLPTIAPPVATERDELFSDILGTTPMVDRGEYQKNTSYLRGHNVYIVKNNLKYYFVSKVNNPVTAPPNQNDWASDRCSKTVKGCRLRYGPINDGRLMFNGFPAVNRSV